MKCPLVEPGFFFHTHYLHFFFILLCLLLFLDQHFTKCRLTVGGDWMWIAAMLGTSGPNGKHFCNSCLVTTDDTPKGKPHAASVLPKYEQQAGEQREFLRDDESFLRTFDGCAKKHAEYVASGRKKENAKDYHNCINAPLLTGPDTTIDKISASPLHISLGLGLQVLNIIENTAINLDKEIKSAQGEYVAFDAVFKHQKEILKKCQTLNSKIETVKDKITQAKKKKIEIVKERAKFFKKNKNGTFKFDSDLAKGTRLQFEALGKDIRDHEQEIEKTKATLKKREKELSKTLEELDKISGPFKKRFDEVLKSLSLKRAVYHSGSLIGPDVKKLATNKNVSKFADIFQCVTMNTKDGPMTFSSNDVRQKIATLLNKFGKCYELYNKNRTLCAHEIEILAIRCVSFGNWFPVNFPEENLRRKFHSLTVEVPRQARRLFTVGMLTEQTIESLHPYINKLDRMFCTVQNAQARGKLICRQHNLFSAPSLPQLK